MKLAVVTGVRTGLLVAPTVTVPARTPVTVLVATPLDAVTAPPAPEIVPVPPVWLKVTQVELSVVTVLVLASSIVAVITRVAPEAEVADRELETTT